MPRGLTGGPRSAASGARPTTGPLEVLTAAGNQHIVLTSEEEWAAFEAALEPVVQRWIDEVTAQGIDGEALVEKARRLIEENSRPEKWASAARSAS